MVEPAETMADDNKSIPEAIATNHAEVKHLLHTIALGTGRIEATRRSPASSARTERLERCGYVVPSHPCRLRSPPSRRGCASAASPAAPIKRRRIKAWSRGRSSTASSNAKTWRSLRICELRDKNAQLRRLAADLALNRKVCKTCAQDSRGNTTTDSLSSDSWFPTISEGADELTS